MNRPPTMTRNDFNELLAQHQELIGLANELEFQLYRLGEPTAPGPVSDCQQAAGALLCQLRALLFRHDQQVLPLLEALAEPEQHLRPCLAAAIVARRVTWKGEEPARSRR